MNREFKLPDVGEGLTEADIVSWRVKPGDVLKVNQVIVEIETAKSLVELPSPWAGTVSGLLVDEGTTVDVGTPIISIEVPEPAAASPAPERRAPTEPAEKETPTRQPVLVGYGVRPGSTTRRPRKAGVSRPGSYPASPSFPPSPPPSPQPPAAPSRAGAVQPSSPAARALAKPPVRRLARDLGVDLSALAGSGPQGSVTREDVRKAAEEPKGRLAEMATRAETVASATAPSPGGLAAREERIPVRGVRKHTAAAMVASAFTAPHVTEFLQVDVTETMAAVRRVRDLPEFAGVKVSPLLFVARALLTAVARHPMINSSWDEAAQEIVVKRYVNLGIAVASERGLLVPSVKGAHGLSVSGLARALEELSVTARAGRATPADLSGGTITITNVGVFGVDAGTPILTPGEAAILAFGAIRDMPWVVDGQLAVRKVTTLSLSFDHRIVDGELGSAVLRDIGWMLEDPIRMLAWS
jgi:2-oxoisovalerate dehydrogenase E2 component (dihydrolipoyl transacylase)